MKTATTRWRVTPAGWCVVGLAVAAEAISNALRAYGLGQHLEKFTLTVHGVPVSLAGSVLVMAAIAVSLSQARAAWVALTPMFPLRQRIVSGVAACLLLVVSATAMSSHILEAQRAKAGDEGGLREQHTRAKDAYDAAKAELDRLGNPRPVSVIQTLVQSTKIDMTVWRRSAECSDISRDDTKEACAPILALYQERGAAARKLELGPKVASLKAELDRLPPRPEQQTISEAWVAGWWAWIMAAAVVLLATFGSVIFATVARGETVANCKVSATGKPLPGPPGSPPSLPLPSAGPGLPLGKDQALADLLTMLAMGLEVGSQDFLAARWSTNKGTISRWVSTWEAERLIARNSTGRRNQIASA